MLPLQRWLESQGVHLATNFVVTQIDHRNDAGTFIVTGIHGARDGKHDLINVNYDDLVFLQNGSMTDASSLGSMTTPPAKLTKADSGGWTLWEALARNQPQFGNPHAFNRSIAESCWESFTVTLKSHAFFDQMNRFTGNAPGIGGLVTFKDSNWLMSIVLAHQPHFANQPADVDVFWGYALFPDRVGNFVAKPMDECNGAFISQFVEIPEDVVFTVEYSIRAAQMAVYELLGAERKVPPVTPHDKSLRVQFEALIKSFK